MPASHPRVIAPAQSLPSDRHGWRLGRQSAILVALWAVPLVLLHVSLLSVRPFWDEAGQFIPTALDLLRHGWWVTRTAIPNVHPPGVEVYLVLWYKVFGYSIPITRVAMLVYASFGLLLTFLLGIELLKGTTGYFALLPPALLLVSPLFFIQSMMAQLDMPAMVWTLLVLLLFLREQYVPAACASIALVLTKETGLATPFVLFVLLVWRRNWKHAVLFVPSALAVACWLLVLHRATGYWLGDPGFAHYNVGYSLHPIRIVISLLRRFYYLFVAEFRFIGTAALLLTMRSLQRLFRREWRDVFWVSAANLILVSVLGGAELERYLLPIIPLLYIAFALAFSQMNRRSATVLAACLGLGSFVNIFWNPPYPFPYEDNYALVDFVQLERSAAEYAERYLPGSTIATAWPYTAGLRDPAFGFVSRKQRLVETGDFNLRSISKIPPERFDVLITYTRTWDPPWSIASIPPVHALLKRFYEFEPPIDTNHCKQLGLYPQITITLRGQSVTIYTRSDHHFKL